MRICFATNNSHKIQEVQNLLGDDFHLISLKEIGCLEEIPEEQGTIEGNSFQKADYVFSRYHTACFSDDSGLEVEALCGAPGVDSAIYAGPHRSHDDNIDLLLKNLSGELNRSARFRTVITFIDGDHSVQFEGEVPGTILEKKMGTGGFGYDPVFQPTGYKTTFAEMTISEKNAFSHRAMAVKKLVSFLRTLELK